MCTLSNFPVRELESHSEYTETKCIWSLHAETVSIKQADCDKSSSESVPNNFKGQ